MANWGWKHLCKYTLWLSLSKQQSVSATHYNLSPNVQQMNGELTGECVLAVIEVMAVLVSLICRLKSCLSCRPMWSHTWSNRTTPSSCFWKRETRNNINSSQKSEYLMIASLYSRCEYVAQCVAVFNIQIIKVFMFQITVNLSPKLPIIHIQYPGNIRFLKHNRQHNCSFTSYCFIYNCG